VRLERGDETMESLARFAAEQRISAAEVTGIGAYASAEVGFHRLEKRDYHRIQVPEAEVVSLLGNLSTSDEGPRVHLHVALGHLDGTMTGGHLFRGVVGATLELFVREETGLLHRLPDEEIGLDLLDL
jgi:predicted DNA-binding protein with PD1-like motif